jgi:predicted transposase YdaD
LKSEFDNKPQEEVQAMFGLSDLKQTRFYQEAFTQGKEERIQQGKQEGVRLQKLKIAPLFLRLV